jgi:hypothetical protein
MPKSFLLLPSHGHAPYLLGVNLLRNLDVDICVPHYYGERQQQVLRDELRLDTRTQVADRVFLSEGLGSLLGRLLRGKSYSPTFDSYIQNVTTHFDEINRDLKQRCKNGIEAISLSGIKKTFSRFDFCLNTGLPVLSREQPVVYAFVGKMSEIYRLSTYQNRYMGELVEIWRKVESSFEHMFIPRLNSLYKTEYDHSGITNTPSLESRTDLDINEARYVPQNSILVVTSGTDEGKDKLANLIASSPKVYNFIKLSESSIENDLQVFPPSVWGHPNVVAVIARSGFGTIWKALLNQKPIGIINTPPEDDPEIYQNAQAVKASGIGTILDTNLDPLIDGLPQYISKIQEQLEADRKIFNETDGIKYTSDRLKQLLSRVKTGG